MGLTAWGGERTPPKHLSKQNRLTRFLNRKPGGLRGVLDAAIDNMNQNGSTTPKRGPIEIPDTEKISPAEHAFDGLTTPGAHGTEFRSMMGQVNQPDPIEQFRRQK